MWEERAIRVRAYSNARNTRTSLSHSDGIVIRLSLIVQVFANAPASRAVFDVIRASHSKRPARAGTRSFVGRSRPKERILRPVSYAECEALHTPITNSDVDSLRAIRLGGMLMMRATVLLLI